MIGTVAIIAWVGVIFWLFARYRPAIAAAVSILGGYLLLPRNFAIDLPAVPTLDKSSITALCVVLAAAMLLNVGRLRAMPAGMILKGMWPRNHVVLILFITLLIGVTGTVVTNGDGLNYGGRVLSSLRLYDALSMTGNALFGVLPFLLARKYIAHPDTHRQLLIVLAVAGLIYSLPALYEVRMSPQLSRMIYGYFPHQWLQHVRAGGFRPVVFLHHGLWLAIFFCCAFVAAISLWRSSSGQMRTRWMIAAAWMLMTLVLAKGVGALAIGLMLGTLIIFLPIRLQILTAAVLAGLVLVYPMLRGAGWVPVDQIVSVAESVDAERASSLAFRIENEDILLEKANERPLFGWGGWGRNRVYDETGRDISVTDGYWILSIGTGGWIGYLAEFGLLTLPLILLALRWRSLALTPATAGVALALTANLLDLLPNATLTPVTWLLAGALAGRLELGRLPDPVTAAQSGPLIPDRQNRYSRQTRRHPPHQPNPA